MEDQDFSANLTDSAFQFPEIIVAEPAEESDLDACSSFSYTMQCEQENVKRKREAMEETEDLKRSFAEIKKLKRMNCLLHSSLQCVSQRTADAKSEQICLQKMVRALHLYKGSLQLKENGEWIERNVSLMASSRDPTEEFMTFDQPDQDAQKLPDSVDLEQQRGKLRHTDLEGQQLKLPSQLEHSPELASLAAVAAASLAMNEGQPASALLDLLMLANKRSLS